jgi:hypothetical protein
MLTDDQLIRQIRCELHTELADIRPPNGVIEQAWEQAHSDAPEPPPPKLRRFDARRRLVKIPAGAAVTLASVTISVVIAVGAVALLGHQHHGPSEHAGQQSSRQQLIDVLAVLRRPQTKNDLAGVRDLPFFRNAGQRVGPALQGAPDWPLVRLATVTPWGERVFFVPMKPPTAKSVAALRHRFPQLSRMISQAQAQRAAEGETLYILSSDGVEGGASAATIKAQGAGATEGRGPARAADPGSSYTRLIRVVPDGVAKVAFVLPRESAAVEPGAPISKHSLTVIVPVHGNVAAVQVDRTQCCDQVPMMWYAADGHVIKRIGNRPGCSTCAPRPQNQPVIQTVPADLQRAFAVFRRPRTAADELPGASRRADYGYGGVNPSLSRLVIATPAIKAVDRTRTAKQLPGERRRLRRLHAQQRRRGARPGRRHHR